MDAVVVSQSLRRTRSSVVLVESFLGPQRQLPSFVWLDSLQPCTCFFAETAEKYVLRVTRETSTVTDTITSHMCWTGIGFLATTVKNHHFWQKTLPLRGSIIPAKTHELPVGYSSTVDIKRFRCAEVLFQPSLQPVYNYNCMFRTNVLRAGGPSPSPQPVSCSVGGSGSGVRDCGNEGQVFRVSNDIDRDQQRMLRADNDLKLVGLSLAN